MGTDIHGIFQKRTGRVNNKDTWETVESEYEENRHYQLFAILAGVRNGFGFAGIKTGEPVIPISEPRGLPADLKLVDEDHYAHYPFPRKYYEPDETDKWLGDHTHSWLSGDEILDYFFADKKTEQCGVITKEEYSLWEGGRPNSYCGDTSGLGGTVIDSTEVGTYKLTGKDFSHVRVKWNSDLNDEVSYFIKEVERLVELHGEIRFVFGFDS